MSTQPEALRLAPTPKAKHTVGPWSAQRNVVNYRSGRKALEIRGAGDELIATLPGCDRDAANAHLIAAAPDLLEALKAIVKSLADQDDEGLIEHAQQMVDARAAIAKATGEQA